MPPKITTERPAEIKSDVPSREYLIRLPKASDRVAAAASEALARVNNEPGTFDDGWLARLAKKIRSNNNS